MKDYRMFRILLMLYFLGWAVFVQAAPDPNFHIYICWGQSNMEGNATVPQVETIGVSDRFKLLYSANDCGQCSREKIVIVDVRGCDGHDSDHGYTRHNNTPPHHIHNKNKNTTLYMRISNKNYL